MSGQVGSDIVIYVGIACVLLFLGLRIQGAIAASPHQNIDIGQYHASQRNEYAVLKYLVPTLRLSGKAGRLYYAASCLPDEGYPYYPYPFPSVKVKEPSNNVSGLEAVKGIFQQDKRVVIEESRDGIISVRIGKIPDTVLKTRISAVTVPRDNQYDSMSVIQAIENTKEVVAVMRKFGIKVDSRVSDRGFQGPVDGLPHFSASLNNVTMDSALDIVADTFKGIIIYGVCTKQRYYTLDFVGGPGYDESYSPP